MGGRAAMAAEAVPVDGEVIDTDIRFAWTWQLLVGLLTSVSVYVLAPLLALYFREPRAQPVIEWLSLACLLTAASCVNTTPYYSAPTAAPGGGFYTSVAPPRWQFAPFGLVKLKDSKKSKFIGG